MNRVTDIQGRVLSMLRAVILLLALMATACSSGPSEGAASIEPSPTVAVTDKAQHVQADLIRYVEYDGEAAAWLDELPAGEALDQVRDWAQYGLASSLGFDAEHAAGFLFDKVPMRDSIFEDVSELPIGSGRAVPDFANDRLYILLDADDPHPERTVALVMDAHFLGAGRDLSEVTVVTTSASDAERRVALAVSHELTSEEARSRFGWVSSSIAASGDLARFAGAIDHLSAVWLDGDDIVAGGWDWADVDVPSITLDDLAVLNASYAGEATGRTANVSSPGFSLDSASGVVDQFEILAAAIPEAGEDFLGRLQDLEVLVVFDGLSDQDQQALAQDWPDGLERYAVVAADAGYVAELSELREAIESGVFAASQEDLEEVASRLGVAPRRSVFWALSSVVSGGGPSVARYEGATEGSEVGMTLFYTDLIAKAWSTGSGDAVPNRAGLEHFVSSPSLPTNWSYCPETNVSGRLWFGLDTSAVAATSADVRLGPVSTRLFSRADSVDGSGIEVEPSFHFGAPLKWWDEHFQQVADYEPQFQRLDQIMRWSTVLAWAGEAGRELVTPPPSGPGLRFGEWFEARDDLVERRMPHLVDVGGDLEVLLPTPSAPFDQCGSIFVEGGVTLAPSRVLSSIRSVDEGVPLPLRRPGTVSQTSTGNGHRTTSAVHDDSGNQIQVVGRTVNLSVGRVAVKVTAYGRLASGLGRVNVPGNPETGRLFSLTHSTSPSGFATDIAANGTDMGRFSASVADGGVLLRWDGGVGTRLRVFANRLQDRLSAAGSGSTIDAALRGMANVTFVGEGATRLVRFFQDLFQVGGPQPSSGLQATVKGHTDSGAESHIVSGFTEIAKLTDEGAVDIKRVTTQGELDRLRDAGGTPPYIIALPEDGGVPAEGFDAGVRVKAYTIELEPQLAPDEIVLDSGRYVRLDGPVPPGLVALALLLKECPPNNSESEDCLVMG